jgi:cytochrome d ubiquinol oxidase subunit I
MSDFVFARSQMAMSLAFHIVFAALGIGMPLLMAIAEGMYLRTCQPVYFDLGKRWSRGIAVLFAVGAVSGTVLSFELGLLWPGFMEKAGAIIGMNFPWKASLFSPKPFSSGCISVAGTACRRFCTGYQESSWRSAEFSPAFLS